MGSDSKIFVAGHNGLVGSAIVRKLRDKGYKKIITANRSKLDLTNQIKVYNFLKKKKPKFIFIAAAKAKGISNFKNLGELNKKESPRLKWGSVILNKMIYLSLK